MVDTDDQLLFCWIPLPVENLNPLRTVPLSQGSAYIVGGCSTDMMCVNPSNNDCQGGYNLAPGTQCAPGRVRCWKPVRQRS